MRHEKFMLMIAWIIYLVMLILFCGCGTKKSAETSETSRRISIDRIEHGQIDGLSISRDSILRQINIKAMIDEIVWAPPDSSGKIYPHKTTRYNIDLTKEDKSGSTDSTTLVATNESQLATTGIETISTASSQHTDTRVIPSWVFIVVVCLVLASIIYYVFRRDI